MLKENNLLSSSSENTPQIEDETIKQASLLSNKTASSESTEELSLYDLNQKMRELEDEVYYGKPENRYGRFQEAEYNPLLLEKLINLKPTSVQSNRAKEINFESIVNLSAEKNRLIGLDVLRQFENLLHHYIIEHSNWDYKPMEELENHAELQKMKASIDQTIAILIKNKNEFKVNSSLLSINKKLAFALAAHGHTVELQKIINLTSELLPDFADNPEHADTILRTFEADKQYSAEKIFSSYIENGNAQNDTVIAYALTAIVDAWGVEVARERINSCIEKSEFENNLDATKNLAFFRSYITPCEDKNAISDLKKFYQENIKFEEYEVNKKMNAQEIKLLKSLIRKDEIVLEMGCGTGRLLLEMQKAGYNITGFDFTHRHVEVIKQQNPEAKVFQADWHKTELPDESQDTVYSLGRNILHDYSLPDQIRLFREANRILKSGGKFIFDVPNQGKGGYRMMTEEYSEEMKKRHIANFQYGTIYDSPDGQHFATRYAYSHDDILKLSQIAGFQLILVKKEPLRTGKNDENIYYILEKK